jgi:CRISPR/Cas system CSM-associated protein Csm4 (group 5 of RAMP superfamily)
VIPEVKPETKSLTKKMIDMVIKKKERTAIFRDMKDTITIALETLKYELLEEEQLKNMLKEIAETTTKIPCNIINHPSTKTNQILNTPNIKIQNIIKTQTVVCSEVNSEVKLHEIFEISTTFKAEAVEIETPQKKYIIITNIIEVKPSH